MTSTAPRRRRTSVSAECLPSSSTSTEDVVVVAHPDTLPLKHTLAAHYLFSESVRSDAEWNAILAKLVPRGVTSGEVVIREGDPGDCLYIVKTGQFQVSIKGTPLHLTYDKLGDLFGELALMYNAPRAATVCALTPGELWSLDRLQFHSLLRGAQEKRRARFRECLNQAYAVLPISPEEVDLVADVVDEKPLVSTGKTSLPSCFIVMSGSIQSEKYGEMGRGQCYLGEQGLDQVQSTQDAVVIGVIDPVSEERLRPILLKLAVKLQGQFIVQGHSFRTSVRKLAGKSFGSLEEFQLFMKDESPRHRVRRAAVSGECEPGDEQPPLPRASVEKTPDQLKVLQRAMHSFMFSGLNDDERTHVIDALRGPFQWKHKEQVIKQGEAGDVLYIVTEGTLGVEKDGQVLAGVVYGPCSCFGELALLYSTLRAATVFVTSPDGAQGFALDQSTMRQVVITARRKKAAEYESIIRNTPLFKGMHDGEISRLVDVLEDEAFDPHHVVIRQGENDRSTMKFYVVISGGATVSVDGKVVREVEPKQFFGEVSLFNSQSSRSATVIAGAKGLRCASIDCAAFERILGPLESIQARLASESRGYVL